MPSIRHNCIRDLLAQYLTEVCPNVAIEPALQPLRGETFPLRSANLDNGARLDVKAQNFWNNSWSGAFSTQEYSTHMHPPTARHQQPHPIADMNLRRAYKRRIIEVEHGSFTPIVLLTSGGWGPSATVPICYGGIQEITRTFV